MNKVLHAILLLLCAVNVGFAQVSEVKRIQGKVLDQSTKEPLPYANILNHSSGKGTISNDKGYFELELNSWKDSIVISYIGYQRYSFRLNSKQSSYRIELKAQTQLLEAVEIRATDYSYLIDLLIECREERRLARDPSKAYFQLKTYSNGQQIELVENFYQASTQGYHLNKLELKAGRLGLRKTNEHVFASLESSKAIVEQNIFQGSPLFPNQPMYLNKRQIKKRYFLDLEGEYKNEEGQRILVLKMQTKQEPERHFVSRIWINQDKKQILKVNLKGKDLEKFPFVPIFEKDSLSKRYLELNKDFIEINGQMFLDHIDFNYGFEYRSERHKTLKVKTNALLKFYEHFGSFNLPLYQFAARNLGEYRIIGALPENEFFWDYNNELKLSDEIDSNLLFMKNPRTLEADDLFNKKKLNRANLFESRFIDWSTRRVIIRALPPEIAKKTNKDYDLHLSLFLDWNQYKDSLNLLSGCLLDPFGSYFNQELDSINIAFVNIFFDLAELERREMMKRIEKSDKSYKTVQSIFQDSMERLAVLKRDYFYQTQAGTYLEDLEIFNQKVIDGLGIDNFEILRIPKSNQEEQDKKRRQEELLKSY